MVIINHIQMDNEEKSINNNINFNKKRLIVLLIIFFIIILGSLYYYFAQIKNVNIIGKISRYLTSINHSIGVEYIMETNKDTYKKGENVNIKFTVINNSRSSKIYDFNTSKTLVFKIINHKGEELYFSEDKGIIFFDPNSFKLNPGKSYSWEENWKQIDNNHQEVPVGNYTIEGYLINYPETKKVKEITITE